MYYQFFIKKKTNKNPPATRAIVLISNPVMSVSSSVAPFTVPIGLLTTSVIPLVNPSIGFEIPENKSYA